jgi:deoxyadenosine/deoxycytidine kinase
MIDKHPLQKNFIVLEGNIGAGKSTMLTLLKKAFDINPIPEPTDKWQKVGKTDNLLELFYKDTPRWAYTFQSYAFLTRVQTILSHHMEVTDDKMHVLERSVYCDRFCFAKNCYESGYMSPLEWHIYKEWFSWLVENFAPRPVGFIYLKTNPEVSHQRILKRCRQEEVGIPLAYLKSLHDKHEDWLTHNKEPLESLKNVPILTLDCNNEFEQNTQQLDKHLEAIDTFISKLQYTKKSHGLSNINAQP